MIEIYFHGYCPESLLKGEQVEMRLNKDDFWESESTGLQIAVFPPFATILKWRGKGQYNSSTSVASDTLVGLIMAAAKEEDISRSFLPDEDNLIGTEKDLHNYLKDVANSFELYKHSFFDWKDIVFEKQEQHLNSISKREWDELFRAYDNLHFRNQNEILKDEAFEVFHRQLYDLGLIFNFKWMDWKKGHLNLIESNFSYSSLPLVQLSMYLTSIFRLDHFNEGNIDIHFSNGNIQTIMEGIRSKVQGK
jgi:hypothetical protein